MLFATMGVCVKLARPTTAPARSSFVPRPRSAPRCSFIASRVAKRRLADAPAYRRCTSGARLIGGHRRCRMWFFSIGNLPLATAMTLNYMSSVWMALFLIGGAVADGRGQGRSAADHRPCCWASSAWGWCCSRTMEDQQVWHGLAGLASGMLSAMAYLQVTSLGRAREPEFRIVFYFSMGGVVAGAADRRSCRTAAGTPTPGPARRCCWPWALLATTAQLLMTRAYGTGKHAGERVAAVPWASRSAFGVRRAAVRRPGHLDGAGRHGADHRRRRSRPTMLRTNVTNKTDTTSVNGLNEGPSGMWTRR